VLYERGITSSEPGSLSYNDWHDEGSWKHSSSLLCSPKISLCKGVYDTRGAFGFYQMCCKKCLNKFSFIFFEKCNQFNLFVGHNCSFYLIYNALPLLCFVPNESSIQQGESTNPLLALVNSTHDHFCKVPEISVADIL